jgi:hypothetical protein
MVPKASNKAAGNINRPKRIAINRKAALKLIVKKSRLIKKSRSDIFIVSTVKPVKYRTTDKRNIGQKIKYFHFSFPKNLQNKQI